jgi:hypothetical protein
MPVASHWRSIFAPQQSLAQVAFYFGAFHDHSVELLEGGKNYRLRVPANVPVREFWSATVYSLKTSSFFLNATRLTLSSLDKEVRKNADGTVDIYFGPKAPASRESNWLYTQPGEKRGFGCMAQRKRILDKSWRLPDIETVS